MASEFGKRWRDQAAGADADQVEFAALRQGSTVVDAGIVDEIVSGAVDDLEVAEASMLDWNDDDLRQDTLVGGAREEIERRMAVLGPDYPFDIGERGQLTHRPSASGFYEFCIGICNAPTLSADNFAQLPRTFERRAAVLVQTYMGADTESFHLGWPRDDQQAFRPAFSRLTHKAYEWVWRPEDGMPEDPSAKEQKDAGVDFVVTKRMLDGRPGRLYILGQCACGNDWKQKIEAPDLTKLKRWFGPMTLVPPIKAFTTPYWLADEVLRDNTGHGLVFDRVRLTLVAQRLVADALVPWESEGLFALARHTNA